MNINCIIIRLLYIVKDSSENKYEDSGKQNNNKRFHYQSSR
jgi:hypothetical protein